ncbi:OmpA family protein [Rhodobacteraceae bacterium 2376]|uniref:OmpA family protein n=1 Tax=Rhabdonatronobacter sediminivivens TaxID=2743469 RepID=A0A7Z0I0G5_9RHOB|nr:OmpA family protein [Rhabdonatronobacter sediminivivens]
MQITRRLFLTGASAAALAACAGPDGMEREAGIEIDEGGFGNPTMRNQQVQSGQIDYTRALAERFAREVPSMVNFAFDSATLDAEARAILRRQAHWIRQFPEVRFRVYGHTDLVGSAAYNHRLGMRRANAVVNYLVQNGVGRDRLAGVVSHGQTRPLVATQAPERANRRTVTEVSGFVGRHPTVMDGRYAQVVHREYVGSATRVHGQVTGNID